MPSPTTSQNNAFTVLMSNQKKKRKTDSPGRSDVAVKSRFIECPAECGRHILEKDMNDHLDRCLLSKNTVVSTPPSKRTTAPIPEEQPASKGLELEKDSERYETEQTNAFSHMMKRSAEIFSLPDHSRWAQRFHLNFDGSMSLICYCTNPGQTRPEEIHWSTNTQIKAGKKRDLSATKNVGDENDSPEPKPVDLELSSAIPSSQNKIRLVRRHSKLSIPVLKSILQKAIRRRKPLPAVRVAMELADKSIGDLLRRLPIIMLEDSMLHPSLPFLTWLMAANSKNFELNEFLLTKVLCAVYEMASCPWQDDCSSGSDTEKPNALPVTDPATLSFDSYHVPGINHLLEDRDVYIWSMLLRARYGGMGCDVRMLNLFAHLWRQRFKDDTNVPPVILKRFEQAAPLRWSTLPVTTHQSAARQSLTRIEPMVAHGLPVLEFADITMEGIDFHCSSVLDVTMSDPWLFQECLTRIVAVSTSIGVGPVPTENSEQRPWLERILKRCMWDYSAGVNRRLPLVKAVDANSQETQPEPLKAMWIELVLPRTKAFAENFIISRLPS